MNTFSLWGALGQAFLTILKSLWFIFLPLLLGFLLFVFMIIKNYIKMRYIKHIVPIKSDVCKQRKTSIFKNIFVLFPRQIANDILHQDPNDFDKFGIRMVVGEQGSGKTITMAYLLQEWRKEYPKLQIYTNMDYQFQNGDLIHWKQLIERNNGTNGVVNVLDEVKTWFSNKDRNVPPEVLGEICQQRKQKKCIFGTAQVFSEIAKPLRMQTHYVYVPRTIMGSLTIVRITKPKYYNDEKDVFKKYCGFFVFAHTKELRESYDTFKKIEKYKDMEFSSPSLDLFQQKGEAPPVVEIALAENIKKKK